MYEKVINLILKKCPSKCTTFFLPIQKIQRKNVIIIHSGCFFPQISKVEERDLDLKILICYGTGLEEKSSAFPQVRYIIRIFCSSYNFQLDLKNSLLF